MRKVATGLLALAQVLAAQTGSVTGQTGSTATQTGSVSGKVSDDSGVALAGAVVTANLRSPVQPGTFPAGPPPPFTPFAASAFSDSIGNFNIGNLPAGTYTLCVAKQGSELLDPCVWLAQTVQVVVGSGAATANVTSPAGVTVSIRIADPGGALSATPQKDDILIGTGNGTSPFIPAVLNEKDSGGKTMTIVVPKGQARNLSVYSSAFQLGDATGNAFGASAATVPIAATQTVTSVLAAGGGISATPTVTIQVIGAAAKP